jgi:hypothetical protein
MSKKAKILYDLENTVIPSWFCSWPCDFLDQCMQNPNMLYQIADSLYTDAGMQTPFPQCSFSAETVRDDSLFRIVRLSFPSSSNPFLYRYAYAIWDCSRNTAEYRSIRPGVPDPFLPSSRSNVFLCTSGSIPPKEPSLNPSPAFSAVSAFRSKAYFRPYKAFLKHSFDTALPSCCGGKHA